MARVKWDETGKKLYRAGVDQGVLYPMDSEGKYPKGVPWNGLSKVTESPSGAESNAVYANNAKYLNLVSAEEFKYTIEAYMFPDEFAECDGSKEVAPGIFVTQQNRKHFGMTYRNAIGNDIENMEYGYEIHFVYDSIAAPSSKDHETVNENVDAATMSWECSTTPVQVQSCKPASHLYIDSTKTPKDVLTRIEDILYGTDKDEPRLPLPDELIALGAVPQEPSDENGEDTNTENDDDPNEEIN